MKKGINIDNVNSLFLKRSSRKVFCEGFKEIIPCRNNYGSFLCSVIFAVIPAIIIASSSDTVELFVKSVETFNGIILSLFGIVFTGYAFFQALINDDLLVRLLASPQKINEKKVEGSNNKSMLQESNEYFINVMMLDVFAIFISSFLKITIGSMEKDFTLTNSLILNNTIAFVGIFTYFVIMFRIVWEMKSFVFNIFQLFNAHAGSKAIELINQEESKNKS